ncbi:uncharacterized protein LAJ45_00227 [Morchella importuna]|uniref:uncharacterized protein n=1 Tax=Morchella importuna TaxID=1174673 RepID=UPI001E8CF3E4|nr:uncharacterized protein LAJ45_00227 [Morchella importuna]KAH8155218.1 hypothetical protein LAJ45_00227 [Morchella importuna]
MGERRGWWCIVFGYLYTPSNIKAGPGDFWTIEAVVHGYEKVGFQMMVLMVSARHIAVCDIDRLVTRARYVTHGHTSRVLDNDHLASFQYCSHCTFQRFG